MSLSLIQGFLHQIYSGDLQLFNKNAVVRRGRARFVWIVRDLTTLLLITFSINCGTKPPDQGKGIRIEHCPISYDLDNPDSLVIIMKTSPISTTRYVWFKGISGPDSFRSCYAKRIEASNDSQTVFIRWKPMSNVSVPVAQYKIIGYMDDDSLFLKPEYSTKYRLLNIYCSGFAPYIVIAYSGCNRTGRQNDNLNDTVAFRIRARVLDSTGYGQNNKEVVFQTSKGKFLESNSNMYTATTTTIFSFPGIAEATLNLSEPSGGPGGADYDYTITAWLFGYGFTSRIFKERCIVDNELSNLPYQYTHKRLDVNNPATEIPGDNLPDGSSEDPNSDKKDVYIEVDYSSALPNIGEMVYEFCHYAEKALERGRVPGNADFYSSGIDVHFVVDESIQIDQYATSEHIRGKLWESRDSSKYIHCILGHYYGDDTTYGGATFGWAFREFNWSYQQRMFNAGVLSSNEAIGNYHIDSMGCFVACERIINLCMDTITGPVLDWDEVVGVAMAHEIGHALGLEHLKNVPEADSTNIMHHTLIVDRNWCFKNWGFFFINRLCDSGDPYYIYALDLLNKLGVETGSVGDHAFDR